MSVDELKDYDPRNDCFRFLGNAQFPYGTVGTALMGNVVVGRIYEVANPQIAAPLRNHPEWEKVSRSEMESQNQADAKAEDKGVMDV